MYADHGYWDLFRAWYPMMSILFPERLGEILQAWVNAYTEGGWLPQFPAPGYRSCMTGSFIDAVFADAAVKGIEGFNLREAYAGMKKHATQPGNPGKGYGRAGIEDYQRLGYIPADRVKQSVAETADAAYADFCIAQVAAVLNERDDHRVFLERSKNWRNLFDDSVKFLRGKNADGSWLSPFDQFAWGSPYVEGSAWQHRWDAPHDIAWLVEALGGDQAAVKALDQMLSLPPRFDVGAYQKEIHEMSEMASVPFGQYAHSNEPVHHLLYIYPHVGRPDRAQYWVRRVLTELYSSDCFPGDEDTGAMSAWFILSALGFYPLCPGKPEYTLGSPLFSEAVVHLPQQRTLRIEAPGNNAHTVFVKSASLNGKPLSRPMIDHAVLVRGGTLHFAVSPS
jgi:predicted alpha-1,2-mannosidase